jgi:hypothetical protein
MKKMISILSLFLLFSCNDYKMAEAFIKAKDKGCIKIFVVTYSGVSIKGNFVLCSSEDFYKRTK